MTDLIVEEVCVLLVSVMFGNWNETVVSWSWFFTWLIIYLLPSFHEYDQQGLKFKTFFLPAARCYHLKYWGHRIVDFQVELWSFRAIASKRWSLVAVAREFCLFRWPHWLVVPAKTPSASPSTPRCGSTSAWSKARALQQCDVPEQAFVPPGGWAPAWDRRRKFENLIACHQSDHVNN